MAKYRVQAGKTLARHGVVHAAGAELEIEPHVATDPFVAHALEPVVEVAQPEPVLTRVATASKSSGEAAKKATADVKVLIDPAPQPDTQE